MICKEVVQEIITYNIFRLAFSTKGICDEMKILLQGVLAIHNFNKVDETAHNVIREVFIIADGNDAILVSFKGHILGIIPFTTGINQARKI